MSKLSEAKKELMALIKEQRARLNPEILAQARRALEGQNAPSPFATDHDQTPQSKEEPYDKQAASDAIKMFLKDHPQAEEFEKKLVKRMHQETQ